MKGKNLILIGVLALAVGLLLAIFRNSLANGVVVRLAAIIFVGAGVLNMTVFLGSRDKDGRSRAGALGVAFGWIASAAAVVLGLAMLIFKGTFVGFIGFMFAVLMLFAAVFQIFLLIFGSRPTHISNWFFLVPAAITGAAIYIFLRKPDTAGEASDLLVTGITFAVFGVATIIEGSMVGQTNRIALRENRRQKTEEKPVATLPSSKEENSKEA